MGRNTFWAGSLCCLLLLLLAGCVSAQAGTHRIEPEATATEEGGRSTATPIAMIALAPALPTAAGPAAVPGSDQACLLQELPYDAHISARGSTTETETQAAGPMVCRIGRDSCAFRRLARAEMPSVIFKGEETPPYNEEDRLMHPDMLLPLQRLAELVEKEWGGEVQLRVTDAYDSLLEHHVWEPDLSKRVALHFEGRSIDLTLWPIERSRYPRLCALAHCAGFDWVHNEGTHCHASVRAASLCSSCND